ncbi:paralemmin-1 isoform X5 [Seriola lalandi dorsalis]|uniref:paralemmin-1 isoform X5 n=1 Tax=Seriola lalandi dorsalis TaxID=1841481 RepID=UPI000C6F6152|nr:paralemmin-1 isoform X5 [Seriola lalandi dorsalis]
MNRAVLDLDSDMEVSQALCQEDRLQLIAEKRKWQTEIENKKRQLEDDRRALQHLKSKALRERWLLDGQEQDEVKRQLEQDEAKTRSLEDTINRLEQELVSLETGSVCQTITHTTVSSGSDKAVEIKGHSSREQERTALSGQVVQAFPEVKVHKSPRMNKPREAAEEMKRVVHEMNGEDGIHLLSSSEVEELIHKADEASMMSQTVATVTSLPTVEVQEEAMPESPPSKPARVAGEITGLEAKPGGEPSVAKASAENPVTMVFMGYQSVEDEAETKKVLGLQGTVTAELVLIDDANGKTSPEGGGKEEASSTAQTAALPPPASPDPPPTTKPPVAIPASNGETAGEVAGEVERGAVEVKKEKQLCKCCSIM